MNFKYLECFLVLCDNLSFSKTAVVLGIAQPAVSRQIRLLEEDLGLSLFSRDKHNVYLTEEGDRLRSEISTQMSWVKGVYSELQGRVDALGGKISIGCLAEVGQHKMMKYFLSFQKKYPEILLRVSYLKEFEIVEKVKAGKLDFGIVTEAITHENMRAYRLMKENAVLVTKGKNQEKFDLGCARFVTYREDDPLLMSFLKMHYKNSQYSKIHIQTSVNSHKSMKDTLQCGNYYSVMPLISVSDEIKRGVLKKASEKVLKSELHLIFKENELLEKRKKLFYKQLLASSKNDNS